MKRSILFVVLLLAATFAAAAGERPTEINADNVLTLMNVHRAEHGLAPLRADERLMKAAADRMRHMEEEQYWAHVSPEGMTPFSWLRVRDYDFAIAGENLATGFETAGLLVDSWMESPGHRENILAPHYEDCGIAVIDGSTSGPATGKSIVVLFARKRPELQIPVIAKRGE